MIIIIIIAMYVAIRALGYSPTQEYNLEFTENCYYSYTELL